MKIVVYSAVTGQYDFLRPAPASWKVDAQFLAFLDSPQPAEGWTVQPLAASNADPCRNAKAPKVLPHLFFDAEYSIWIDGSIQITSSMPITAYIKEALTNADIALFRHRRRNCIYEEAKACVERSKDDPARIKNQVEHYRRAGYPRNNGLAECTVIVRRHTPAVQAFNAAWFQEIQAHSRRDQLSFDYVAWRLGVRYSRLEGTIAANPHFRRFQHQGRSPVAACAENSGDSRRFGQELASSSAD